MEQLTRGRASEPKSTSQHSKLSQIINSQAGTGGVTVTLRVSPRGKTMAGPPVALF